MSGGCEQGAGARWVLASGSPRRRELLAREGYVFRVVPSPAEELHDARMEPGALCEENAWRKAEAVARQERDAMVLGADTLVFLDGEPLGKPADLAEARAMLARLGGRTHEVITGVCVIPPGSEPLVFHERTKVHFRPLAGADIEEYLARVNPLDKAGSYGIQEHGERLVAAIEGCYDNVMGLPVKALGERLRAAGFAGRGGTG